MTRRDNEAGDDLLLEDRFAIVPEWLLDAEVGDAAVRLYAVLLRLRPVVGFPDAVPFHWAFAWSRVSESNR